MRIGAFAELFNLNPSAVRFYINNGLLTPDKAGKHYEFNKQCVSDMDNILKFKKFHFSLDEIQLLFFMEKASRFQDEIVLEVCSDILKNKRKQLLAEKENLTQIIEQLDYEIENLPVPSALDMTNIGVPFSFIPYLYCPDCQTPLNLESASLSNGCIQKGVLLCECGYRAVISDGVILCKDHEEETPFKAFENVDSVIAMKNQFSPTYRLLIAKTYIWMYGQVSCRLNEPRYILTGPFTFNFLLETIEKLGKDHTYIVFDPSIKRISKIKKYLSAGEYNVIYIAGKPEDLPVKHSTIDIFIDDYSTTNSMFTYSTFSTEFIAPLLKNYGEVVGIFTTYKNAVKSLYNFKSDHPDFDPSRLTLAGIKHQWNSVYVKTVEEKCIGETTCGEIHFPQNVIGETINVYGYHAKKFKNKATKQP